MSADLFRKAEEEFLRLKRDLVAGRINLDQFHSSLKEAKVTDHLGHPWAIGANSGEWYFHDGQSWVRADPYGILPDASSGATPPPVQDTPLSAVAPPFTPSAVEQVQGVGPEPASISESPLATPPVTPQPIAVLAPSPTIIAPSASASPVSVSGVAARSRTQTWLIFCAGMLVTCAVLCLLAVIAVAVVARMR